MHNFQLKKFYFISKFKKNHLIKLSNKIGLIYRNPKKKEDIYIIKKISRFCKINNREFYISNNFKLALKLRAYGVYLSAFNKNVIHNCYSIPKNFKIIGSAHNKREINEKIKQKVNYIFLSPVFKKKVKKLGIYGFLNLQKYTKRDCIVLGGITSKNLKYLKFLRAKGFAGIEYFNKKKGP